ncbi:unnamed protein product, partial [Durusdinium trenchii]
MRRARVLPLLLLPLRYYQTVVGMPRFQQLEPQSSTRIVVEARCFFALLDAWRVLWDHLNLGLQESDLAPYLVQGQSVASRGELKLRALSYFASGQEEDTVGPVLALLDVEARRKLENLLEEHPKMPPHRQDFLRTQTEEVLPRARAALQNASDALRSGSAARWATLPSWTANVQVLQAALKQIETPEMAEMGASQGRGQEEDVGSMHPEVPLNESVDGRSGGHWLTEVTGGKNHLKFYRNLQVGASKKKEVPQGVKAELDGAIVAEGEGDELPQLQAIVECKWGLSMYGDLQKMDALLHFLYESGEAQFQVGRSGKSLKLQLPKGLEVKYFMGHLPDGEGEGDSLDRLLRPSALRQEKGRLLSSTFSPGCAARASMELVDFQGPWAVLVELPEDEVARAQARVDAFLQDVLQRMERGTLSIYVRATSEHK